MHPPVTFDTTLPRRCVFYWPSPLKASINSYSGHDIRVKISEQFCLSDSLTHNTKEITQKIPMSRNMHFY